MGLQFMVTAVAEGKNKEYELRNHLQVDRLGHSGQQGPWECRPLDAEAVRTVLRMPLARLSPPRTISGKTTPRPQTKSLV